MGKIWPFILVVCLLTVPKIGAGEILPEGKIAVITEQAATVLDGLSARLRPDPKITMTWPCNESDSLALASDTSSKRYSFRS
ncbi:MAG: hypothetical protein IKY08_02305, partial [Firmicutes bacterium]|nr:hypothetical protein [Bacillota bacterium]